MTPAWRGGWSARPATATELKRVVDNNTRSLPGAFETSGDVLGSLISSNRFGRPWNYPASLKESYEGLSLSDVEAAADEAIHPESLVWIIVGDRAQIEAGVRSLGLGPIEVKSIGDL